MNCVNELERSELMHARMRAYLVLCSPAFKVVCVLLCELIVFLLGRIILCRTKERKDTVRPTLILLFTPFILNVLFIIILLQAKA